MGHIRSMFINLLTYLFTVTGIVVNFENVKSVILFIGGIILLVLQIKLYLIKIVKERKNKKEDGTF